MENNINHKILKTYVSASGVAEHDTRKAGGFKATETAWLPDKDIRNWKSTVDTVKYIYMMYIP